LLASAGMALRRHIIYKDVRKLQILQLIDSDDAIVARAVDQKIARRSKEKGSRHRGSGRLRGLQHANVDVIAQVLDVICFVSSLREVMPYLSAS